MIIKIPNDNAISLIDSVYRLKSISDKMLLDDDYIHYFENAEQTYEWLKEILIDLHIINQKLHSDIMQYKKDTP